MSLAGIGSLGIHGASKIYIYIYDNTYVYKYTYIYIFLHDYIYMMFSNRAPHVLTFSAGRLWIHATSKTPDLMEIQALEERRVWGAMGGRGMRPWERTESYMYIDMYIYISFTFILCIADLKIVSHGRTIREETIMKIMKPFFCFTI